MIPKSIFFILFAGAIIAILLMIFGMSLIKFQIDNTNTNESIQKNSNNNTNDLTTANDLLTALTTKTNNTNQDINIIIIYNNNTKT